METRRFVAVRFATTFFVDVVFRVLTLVVCFGVSGGGSVAFFSSKTHPVLLLLLILPFYFC